EFLGSSGIKGGQLGMGHEYIGVRDEEVDELEGEMGVNEGGLLEGVEEGGDKGVFLLVELMEKGVEVEMGVLLDVREEGGGIG
ncbi:hypothetical protein, partial [Neisseria sicca]|uniref:hypothetical protein n=1 Tax=Neisseria sicca TaxID=490 RepID=UPI001649CC70